MDEKEVGVINIIPFVDIMLVLLTIVLTTSTFIARGAIPLELPRASRQAGEALKTSTIEIDNRGLIFVDGAGTTVEGLPQRIGQVSRDTPVLIRADRGVALQAFVNVMDTVKNMGFRRVSLQTETRN